MAYIMDYWERLGVGDNHASLKTVRLKSINEIQTLALPHNRPLRTDLITINRSDNQSNWEHIVWEASNPEVYHLERNRK